jgi:hypothetical protein
MGYHVEFVEPVLDYLARVEGLTDADRQAIIAGVTRRLSESTDVYLALYPLSHESLAFWYHYPHTTQGALYQFSFVVSAHHLEMGVVAVAYAEHTTQSIH